MQRLVPSLCGFVSLREVSPSLPFSSSLPGVAGGSFVFSA